MQDYVLVDFLFWFVRLQQIQLCMRFLSWQRIGSYAFDCLIDFVMSWCGIIGALSSICSSTSFRILAVMVSKDQEQTRMLWLQYLKSLQVHDSIATQN
jgi:hypothetical protein